jgi:glycosyltransferase involved in cell wall biosynthesis
VTTPVRPRVALVTYGLHCGGMEAALLRLAQYLQDHECVVEVITTVEPGEWFTRFSRLGIKTEHVPGSQRPRVLAPLLHSVRVVSRLIRGNYDIVFLNHTRHAQAALARLPDRVVAIPVLHNDNPEIYDVGCANQDAWNVAVAVSPKVAATAKVRVPQRPVLHLPYGVDLPNAMQWEHRKAPNSRLNLVFVGRLEHGQKGVLFLPAIYRACLDRGIDASLTIIGDGPDAGELQGRLSEAGLADRTRRLTGLTPEGVYSVLLDSHILLMPSHYEGLPIALLESLACGCVPIASRLPGITDAAIQEGTTGFLVDVGDVMGFADAVAALSAEPQQWLRMSRAGHECAVRSFSIQAMGQRYRQLIQDALGGRYPLPRSRKHQRVLDLSVFPLREFVPSTFRRLGRRGRSWLSAGSAALRSRARS